MGESILNFMTAKEAYQKSMINASIYRYGADSFNKINQFQNAIVNIIKDQIERGLFAALIFYKQVDQENNDYKYVKEFCCAAHSFEELGYKVEEEDNSNLMIRISW